MFEQLSVFAGGWTLDAAEAVASGRDIEEWQVLDLLAALVSKSLVQTEVIHGTTRYRLLETLRAYAAEHLLQRAGRAAGGPVRAPRSLPGPGRDRRRAAAQPGRGPTG